MPFDQCVPRPLSPVAIHAYAPATSGVYGISNASEWIYIGETDNLQDTLLAHVSEVGTPLKQRQPTGFVFEVCSQSGRPARQDRLVSEYRPVCNQRSRRQL